MTGSFVRRASRLAAGVSFACWIAGIGYLSYRVFVAGLSPAEQRAANQLPHQPLDALAEPLFAMLTAAIVFGVCAIGVVAYSGYAQWRSARRRRRSLESEYGRERNPEFEASD